MSFQILPREIRNQIYFFVILLERDAPTSPHHEGISTRYRVKGKRPYQDGQIPENVHHEDGPFLLPYTCLSRTNRQIRTEVQEALITAQSSGKLVYKIDLMVDNVDIYLTSLSVPPPAKHLAELRVDFRRVSDTHRNGWWSKYWPGSMTQTLVWILSRFIAHGPALFGEVDCEVETLFDVLTLRLIDTEFMDLQWSSRISPADYDGLSCCVGWLRHYNLLGCKTKLVRVHYGDQSKEFRISETQASHERVKMSTGWGWYDSTLSRQALQAWETEW